MNVKMNQNLDDLTLMNSMAQNRDVYIGYIFWPQKKLVQFE